MQNESISPIRNVLIPKSAMQSDGSNLALFDYSDLFVKPYGKLVNTNGKAGEIKSTQRSPLSSVGRAPGF